MRPYLQFIYSYSLVQMNESYAERVKDRKGMIDYFLDGVSNTKKSDFSYLKLYNFF